MSEGVFPAVRILPPPAQPYRPPADEAEIRALVAAALGGDIVIEAKSEDGEVRTFVSPPRTGDRAVDELIALASVPVDYDIIGLEPAAADPAVEATLVAAAGQSKRRERRALVAERRRAAEEHFAQVEQEALERSRARCQPKRKRQSPARPPEPVLQYVRERWAAARERQKKRQPR